MKPEEDGCRGLALVINEHWSTIISRVSAPASADHGELVLAFRAILDQAIGQVPSSNHCACRGGNTFVIAGFDESSNALVISKLARIGDRRRFEGVAKILSDATAPSDISRWGNTDNLQDHIANINATYAEDMNEEEGVAFAKKGLAEAIQMSGPFGQSSIGGDFI
jgi:hypothetical protein